MRAIGIDLGTTNSAAAVAGSQVQVLPTRHGEQLTPSVVGYVKKRKSQEGEIVIGRPAVNNAPRDPENTIFSIKRLMGLTYGEERTADVGRRYSFRLADAPAEDAEDQGVKVHLGNDVYSPVDISSMILKQVRADAEQSLGEAVTHAVITVPAYFTERQRDATHKAGEMAGLKVLKIIDEPTAAAIAFGADKPDERHRVLVYDLGGGTFDISVIQMVNNQYQGLQIEGDTWLGGDDFDQTIVKRMIDWVKDEYDVDATGDTGFLTKAKEEAQKAKIALSSQESVEIFAPLLRIPGGGVSDVDMVIDRKEFEADIQPIVDKTIDLVRKAMADQHLSVEDITQVLMVGGSTTVPLVHSAVAEEFGVEKVKRNVNPMECVALGAAILAEQFDLQDDGEIDSTNVDSNFVEPTAMHLGIAAVKGDNTDAFVPIIEKGTPYPLSEPKTRTFRPTEDNQRLIKVPVYEGLNEIASLNEQQGVIEFPLPQGIDASSDIVVSFNYDRNRVLTVGIRVLGTELTTEERLQRDRGKARRPGQDSETLLEDWREELQPRITAGRHFIDTYGDYMDSEDQEELSKAIIDGEASVENEDEINGKKAMLVLQNKIMGSGVASQLFIAERAMHGAPPEVAKKIAEAVASLREAHAKGDEAHIEELSGVLRVVVARVMAERQSIASVEDRKSLDNLLRVRE